MGDQWVCPVCGYDESRNVSRHSSLAKIRPESRIVGGPCGKLPQEERERTLRLEYLLRQPWMRPDPSLWEGLPSGEICLKKNGALPDLIVVPEKWLDQPVRLASFAFHHSGIRHVLLPLGLREIGDATFIRCGELQEIILPGGVEYIGKHSFAYCESLREVCFPAALRMIDDYAFELCRNLESLEFPQGLEAIGRCAFSMCDRLERVALPDSLKEVGVLAFYRCKSLKELAFPQGLEKLDTHALADCWGLKRVVLPASWQGRPKSSLPDLPRDCEVVYRG